MENFEQTITFGKYKDEPITWIVAKEDDDKKLLLSEKIIEFMPFMKCTDEEVDSIDIEWENSTVRSWLNNILFFDAFTEDEQNQVLESEVENKAYPQHQIEKAKDTKDKVFLLSIGETENLADEGLDLSSENTQYAVEKQIIEWKEIFGEDDEPFISDDWLLRTSDALGESYTVSFVTDGDVIPWDPDQTAHMSCGVRPALWIKK